MGRILACLYWYIGGHFNDEGSCAFVVAHKLVSGVVFVFSPWICCILSSLLRRQLGAPFHGTEKKFCFGFSS